MTALLNVRRLVRHRWNAQFGLLLMALFVLAAAIGWLGTPHDPLLIDIRGRLQSPNLRHWLGTDQFGRDMLSRILIGARESLLISLFSASGALLLGVSIGATTSFIGGWTDRLTGAVLDAVMAFPGLLLALAIIAVAGPGKYGVIIALSLAYAPTVARVIRSSVLSLREREFIDASRVLGNSEFTTLFKHVVPNCLGPLTVIGASIFATALLSESALSFLGLGVPPPFPTWGGMLADAKQFAASAPWLVFCPGLAISIALLAANLLGDGLRDYFDPRMDAL